MIKKSITFTNLDGQRVTEEHYFHMTKAELVEMQVAYGGKGDMETYLKSIIASNGPDKGGLIITAFKDIIAKSYGVRTPNGGFRKSAELSEEFMSSEAYSEFFMELISDAGAASEFVRGMVPADLAEGIPTDITNTTVPEAKEVPGRPIQEVELPTPDENVNDPDNDLPAWFKENRQPTRRELMLMGEDELKLAMRMRNR